MVEEIRALPISIANPTIAHAHNLLGSYTKMNLILRSNLHFRMIQKKLTPMLGLLTGPMEEEVKFAMNNHFPRCEEWTTIKPYHTILDLVARTSARVFVGLPLCRSAEWLDISTQFTEEGKILGHDVYGKLCLITQKSLSAFASCACFPHGYILCLLDSCHRFGKVTAISGKRRSSLSLRSFAAES